MFFNKYKLKLSVSIIVTAVMFMSAIPTQVYARGNGNGVLPAGNMSFFGGISEGVMLPRTTESMLLEQGTRRNRRQDLSLRYSELVFLAGAPVRFDGTLDISSSGTVNMDNQVGTFHKTHTISSSSSTNEDIINLSREVRFLVNYRVEGRQVIFTYDAVRNDWEEEIEVGGRTFVLDNEVSHFVVSIIEDRTPGVSYYRGDISARLVYVVDDGDGVTIKEKVGSFHGYRSAWSAVETHRIDVRISHYDTSADTASPGFPAFPTFISPGAPITTDAEPTWQLQYQLRPSITMNKVLQFVQNEPTPISFDGNFREVMQNNVGLWYDIFTMPAFMQAVPVPVSGNVHIDVPNTFEQLPSPDLSFLRGNPAEDDIRRLFSTQILRGNPRFFVPSQAITRGEFVAAVTRAIRLPIEEPITPARARVQPDISVFFDVPNTRPEYPYIMAAHRAGLAVGRANSMFYFDYPIERQEAFMIMIRALGLSQMSLNPTPMTPFLDDALIAHWARREVTVAQMIGLANPVDGFFRPTMMLSKGEAANILNELVEYMRVGLISDYVDQIVFIPN